MNPYTLDDLLFELWLIASGGRVLARRVEEDPDQLGYFMLEGENSLDICNDIWDAS